MDRVLERRLSKMERRMAALESALDEAGIPRPAFARPDPRRVVAPTKPQAGKPDATGAAPPPLPTIPDVIGPAPAPVPAARHAPEPKPAPKPTPQPAKEPLDWERFFGLAVLGRVGVAAVLLAAGYFAQLAYRGLPPLGKVLSIYALGGAFLGVGAWLRPKVATRYVAMLWGGGAASLYLAAVAAHLRYDLVGDTFALLLLAAASAVGLGLARVIRHQTLASVALAGAIAAPLIADASLAKGSFLMVYLLLLHGLGAWAEERWKWVVPRMVALLGVGVVVMRWLQLHGGVDVPTFLLLHGYLLGLAAPEFIQVARRQPLSSERRLAVPLSLAIAEFVLFSATFGGSASAAVVMLLAGVFWTGLACVLIGFARDHGNAALVRGVAQVGGVLTAIAVVGATQALPAAFPLASETVIVWGCALVALGALALRGHLGVGELTGAVAVPIACVTSFLPRDPNHVFILFPVACATAAAITVFGRHVVARAVTAWFGLIALGFGLIAGLRFEAQDTIWIPLAIVGTAAWARGVMAIARRSNAPGLGLQGVLQFWAIGLVWIAYGFDRLAAVRLPLLDPMTLAALLVAAGAAHAAWHWRSHRKGVGSASLSLWLLALALPVLAGHREMLSAVEGLAAQARDAWHVLYFCGAGVLIGWFGRGGQQGRRMYLMLGALVVTGVGVVKVVLDGQQPYGTSAWTAAELAAALAAPLALGWLAIRGRREHVMAAWGGVATAAFAHLLHASAGHLPHATPFLDLRFLVGLLALAALWLFPYFALAAPLRRGTATTALLGGLLLGFIVGYVELWQLVRSLDDAWPAVLVSVYMALFAAGTLAVGFVRGDTRLRYPALGLFGLVVLKVGLHDLAEAATALRIFVTGILGLVLLAAAYAYARKTPPEDPPASGVDGSLPAA